MGTDLSVLTSTSNPESSVLDINATDGITADQMGNFNILNIRSAISGNCDITANPQIAAGRSGQIIILIGQSDTKTVQIDTGNGVYLQQGQASVTLGLKDAIILEYNASTSTWIQILNEVAGFVLKDGITTGQTIIGGTYPEANLTLKSTSDATKGNILIQPDVTSATAGFIGIGTSTPAYKIDLAVASGDVFARIVSATAQLLFGLDSGEGILNVKGDVKISASSGSYTYGYLKLVAATGNFGIDVSTPDSKWTVNGDLALVDGMTAPATKSGYAKIYIDSADGDLKVKFGDGTVKTIATDT